MLHHLLLLLQLHAINLILAVCPENCTCTKGIKVDCTNRFLLSVPKNIPSTTTELNLDGNFINIIKRGDFKNLKYLQTLSISSCRVLTIEDYSFEELPALTSLSLNDNLVSHVKNDTLKGLSNLKYLDMSKIGPSDKPLCLADETFAEQQQLETLKLVSNQLVELTNGTLFGLKNLQILHLTKNDIKIIETGAFLHFTVKVAISWDLTLQCCCSIINAFHSTDKIHDGACVIKNEYVLLFEQTCTSSTPKCEKPNIVCVFNKTIFSATAKPVTSTFNVASTFNVTSTVHVTWTFNVTTIQPTSSSKFQMPSMHESSSMLSSSSQLASISSTMVTRSTSKDVASKSTIIHEFSTMYNVKPSLYLQSTVSTFSTVNIPEKMFTSIVYSSAASKTYTSTISPSVTLSTIISSSKAPIHCELSCINEGKCILSGNHSICLCHSDYRGQFCEEAKEKPLAKWLIAVMVIAFLFVVFLLFVIAVYVKKKQQKRNFQAHEGGGVINGYKENEVEMAGNEAGSNGTAGHNNPGYQSDTLIWSK